MSKYKNQDQKKPVINQPDKPRPGGFAMELPKLKPKTKTNDKDK